MTLPIVWLYTGVVFYRWGGWRDLLFVTPALVGYAAAALLWTAASRNVSPRRAWLYAAVGIATVLAVSYAPVEAFAQSWLSEWRETQPWGRGYDG